MSKNIMDIPTVCFNEVTKTMDIIDQTLLPYKVEVISLKTQGEIWEAINILRVRGAPAIGVSAAIGIYMAAFEIEETEFKAFYKKFVNAKDYLNSARPTAVNLEWALNKMEDKLLESRVKSIEEIKLILHDEAVSIYENDISTCKKIGEYGLSLVKPGFGLLTHCNAGKLATVQYGTATAPMYCGYEKNYDFKVFCDETRPLLQGARLTAFELKESGLDVTVICDNMSASVMKKGLVDAIFVGCDRVAANGDTANKIGTSMVAICAKKYNIPFYVCAPTSTIDMNTPTGDQIHIEQRNAEEVTEMWYKERMAPKDVNVFNPAFDVSDKELITAFVTEKGIIYPPFNENFKKLF